MSKMLAALGPSCVTCRWGTRSVRGVPVEEAYGECRDLPSRCVPVLRRRWETCVLTVFSLMNSDWAISA